MGEGRLQARASLGRLTPPARCSRRARLSSLVAFDGRASFSRPGPQLVEGAEALAAWLSGVGRPDNVGTITITEANDDR